MTLSSQAKSASQALSAPKLAPADKPAPVPASGRRRVLIRDMEIVASVGVFEHEKRYEQRIVVSLELDVEDAYDGRSDRLEHVLDYAAIVDGVVAIVQAEHVHLIETLAERIAAFCLSDLRVQAVKIKIEKPDVLPQVRSVGIEIERSR